MEFDGEQFALWVVACIATSAFVFLSAVAADMDFHQTAVALDLALVGAASLLFGLGFGAFVYWFANRDTSP